jgi:hypothetical protein
MERQLRRWRSRPRLAGLLVLVAVALGLAGWAYASIPARGGRIDSCYLRVGGQLRVIDRAAGARCRAGERPLSWNQRGRRGPAGPAGPTGPVGPTGPAGAAGSSSALSAHRGSGPSNAPAGPGFTTIVTQQVPAGFYVFIAKTVIITSTSTGSDCILTYDIGGGEVEADRSNQSPFNSAATARTTHNLQRLLQFGTQAATIRLKCRAGTAWSASDSNIIAIQVQKATDTEVTG